MFDLLIFIITRFARVVLPVSGRRATPRFHRGVGFRQVLPAGCQCFLRMRHGFVVAIIGILAHIIGILVRGAARACAAVVFTTFLSLLPAGVFRRCGAFGGGRRWPVFVRDIGLFFSFSRGLNALPLFLLRAGLVGGAGRALGKCHRHRA